MYYIFTRNFKIMRNSLRAILVQSLGAYEGASESLSCEKERDREREFGTSINI